MKTDRLIHIDLKHMHQMPFLVSIQLLYFQFFEISDKGALNNIPPKL